MTVQQIVEWVDAFNSQTTQKIKETASLLNGQALQIISGIGGMFQKRSKFLTLEKLYPELFQKKVDTSNMTQEQIQETSAEMWRLFLGV